MLLLRMILVGFLMFQNIYSQIPATQFNFFPPLDIPLYLSGNFGEIRSAHFHSGLDFKTQGITGKSVYSVDEGYVSRIKIQTAGYGNSIYITHPGGFTSVYGHLERFNDAIASYVKDYQYQKKTHTIDIYPDKELFKVNKGDVIAISGNTGSSGGPHLHFELRRTSSQHPLNGLLYGFNVKDNLPPQLYKLYVYPLSETSAGRYPEPKSYLLERFNGFYRLNNSDTITLRGSIGFGLETADYLNDINNQCGVFSMELSVNDQVVYLFRIDEFSFNESVFVNAHGDYRALMEAKKEVQLLYIKPNNRLGLYPVDIKRGVVFFSPGESSKVDIVVKDAYGNASTLKFFVKGIAPSIMLQKPDSTSYKVFKWNTSNYFENSLFRLSISANSLSEDCVFNYSRADVGFQSIYPYTHYIGDRFAPLIRPADISFSGDMIPEQFRKKVLIAMIEDSNKISCLTSTWSGNMVSARANKFGKYTLVVDTVAPVIIPINFLPGSNMKSKTSLILKVTDEISGINEYQGFIDDSWALFEYDPKNEVIVYTFDTERLISNIEHKLAIQIKDSSGNQKVYQTRFTY